MYVNNYPKFFFLLSFYCLDLQCYLFNMNTTEIETKAKIEFIQSYEWLNEIDLKGYFPEDTTTQEYQAAKRRALHQTRQYNNKEVYFYILNNF